MAFNINNFLDSAGEFLGIGGDPFSTEIGQKVLGATHEDLKCVDWNLNLNIVDLVNSYEEGPKDAVRAIRRRMQNTVGKNDHCVYYSLVLLETLAKNCGRRFHILICHRDFANELINKIVPASENAQLVQDKVLTLLQSWAHAFSVDPELQGVAELYLELKKKGVEFPPPSDDDILLVQRNQSGDFSGPPSSSSSSSLMVSPSKQSVASKGSRPTSRSKTEGSQASRRVLSGHLSQRQITRMNEDLRKTEETISVLSEMLSEVIPGQEEPEDRQMLHELASNCKEMQSRVLQLLQILEDRTTVQRLLDINDNFNNVFMRFERYQRNQPSVKETEPVKQDLRVPASGTPSRPTSSDAANLVSRPDDIQEIEEWMKSENMDLSELEDIRREFEEGAASLAAAGTAAGGAPDAGTTEEFQTFLKKRAEAAKQLEKDA